MFRRRQQENAGPATMQSHRYQMREKWISFGDDYYIENEQGQRVFHIDGKMLRVRDTLWFDDMSRNHILFIQEKWLPLRDTMKIQYANGQTAATVHKAFINLIRDNFKIDIPGGKDLNAHGNILDHEYEIKQDNWTLAQISKRWFRLRDTYGVEVAPGQNDLLMLAITVCIDMMTDDKG